MSLYKHQPHEHTPRNPNHIHKEEQAQANFNQRVAIGMTKLFSSMLLFWCILLWILLWIVANATIAHFDPLPWPLLLCLASVPQLPLMIVIMVGQGVLGRKAELQADEQYKTTIKTYHDIEQIMLHLSAQDEAILHQSQLIEEQNKLILQLLERKKRTPRKAETKGQVL
jgi:uncharacterized membrane protein